MASRTTVQLIEFGYQQADADVARSLGTDVGAPVQRAVRVRRMDGVPLSHVTTYVPEDIGRAFSRTDLEETALLELLERAGVRVAEARQAITATLADADIAKRLECDIGSPLLRIVRVVVDQSGRPVEFITGLYRSDRFQYEMMLTRSTDSADRQAWAAKPGQPL